MYILFITFMGLVLPQESIGLREENVKAVTQGRESQTASEPSKLLTKKEEPFVFDPEQQAAFTELKRQLAQAESLGNFERNAKIEIITDSSPVGADDTSFTISSYNPAQKQSKLNSDLAVIQTWLQVNKLSPNVKKAKYFIIGSHDRLGNLLYSLEIAKTYMYLGVNLDESLSWDSHIDNISLVNVLVAIKQVRNLVTRETVIMIYKALIQPYFDCSSSV